MPFTKFSYLLLLLNSLLLNACTTSIPSTEPTPAINHLTVVQKAFSQWARKQNKKEHCSQKFVKLRCKKRRGLVISE